MIKRLLYIARVILREPRFVLRSLLRPRIVRNFGIRLTARDPVISPFMRGKIYRNFYEAPEMIILARTLEPQDRVLELGGGVGYVSSYLAQVCGNRNVVSVEANPTLAPLIARNHRLNGVSPTVVNAAVGDGGSIEFVPHENFWSGSTAREGKKTIQVPTVGIESLIIAHRPSFLIMDIEGAELTELPKVDFTNIDKVLLEVHPQIYGLAKANDILRLMLSAGYDLNFRNSDAYQLLFEKADERRQ